MQGYWPLLGPLAFLSLPVYQCQEVTAAHPAVLLASHPSPSLLHPGDSPALGIWGDMGLHHHAGVIKGCCIPELHLGLSDSWLCQHQQVEKQGQGKLKKHLQHLAQGHPGCSNTGGLDPRLSNFYLLPFLFSHTACLHCAVGCCTAALQDN